MKLIPFVIIQKPFLSIYKTNKIIYKLDKQSKTIKNKARYIMNKQIVNVQNIIRSRFELGLEGCDLHSEYYLSIYSIMNYDKRPATTVGFIPSL